jgi:predicted ATPase/class 3 adenylate cyclase
MEGLPEGTLTFLFTDLEGSTKAWESSPGAMRDAMARHDRILAGCLQKHRGIDVRSGRAGDSTVSVFTTAADAAACALAIERAFREERWPPSTELKVRVALHTGEVQLREGQYLGQALNRCARLLATGHGGQILVTQATEELVVDELPERAALRDLGFHRLKDLSRAEHVFELVDLDQPQQFPPLRSIRRELSNLPYQVTSFVGREPDLAHLREVLPAMRLLTLTGPAGVGKTRLAIQGGWDVITDYDDGVWLAELSAIGEERLVPQAVADALSLREQPGRRLTETLQHYLVDRRLLLILDNCEHLVAPVAELVAALLKRCPLVNVLATSREPLRVAGETVWRVRPLGRDEGVRLFAERARAREPGFEVSDDNVEVIASTCQHLDGLPLAIELAAPRVAAMTLPELRDRLEKRFLLLTGGDRTASGRLKTLRAAIDWSYELLDDSERQVFRRASIFAERFSLPAAEAVCGGEPAQNVLEALGGLVDKSMVSLQDGRYHCLETLREYGRERVEQAGETNAARNDLARYLLALAQDRQPGQLAIWLDRLEWWHDDIRATLDWALDNDPQLGVQLTMSLYLFWQLRSHASEPRLFVERLLDRLPEEFPLRPAVLYLAGAFAYVQGDLTIARGRLGRSLEAARRSGDRLTELQALETSGLVAVAEGDVVQSEAALEEALTLAQHERQPENEAAILHQLGLVASRRGDQRRARTLFERSIEIRRSLGRADEASMPLTFLAAVALLEGDLQTARQSIVESLQIGRALRDRRVAWSLEVLACVSVLEGQLERGLQLAGAGEAMHEIAGNRPPPTWHQFVGALVQPAKDAIGEAAAAKAWDAGRKMGLEEAIEFALESGREPALRRA